MLFPVTLCFLAVASVRSQEVSNDVPTVNIGQGTVLGSTAEDGNYFEFYGIPYADSTSGINRFKAPRPAPTFHDTFIANRKDVKCVHALGVGYAGTEDCLVANIFTPTLNSSKNLPVMVWIKGKEFDKAHEQKMSFKNFVDKDIVIVSLNFRESILGFLCLGTQTAPGNAGLKDIIAGLRWIQENIAQFGGDPNNVSLFGHGSGAAAVDLITMSPMANGLVHKAIAQSGTAMAPWAVTRDNTEYAVQVAEALGHTITNINELSDVFTKTSVAALMAVINELDLTDNSLAFAPCVEREDLESVEPFLTKSPYITISEGSFLQIPFMTGFVDNEGTIRAEEAIKHDWLNRMETSFTDFIQPDLKFEDETQRLTIADEVKSFYFENAADNINIDEFITYHGDTMILVSAIREARMRANVTSDASIYLYQFSYKGTLGKPFTGPLDVNSAAHSEELAYLFHGSDDSDIEIPLIDLTVADILVERWTNFAKTGIPTSESSIMEWQPFTQDNPVYLRVLDKDEANSTLEILFSNPHPETVAFWEAIYEGYFKDAEGRWNLTEKIEEEDVVDTTDSGDGVDVDGATENPGAGDGDGSDSGSENGNGGDEATENPGAGDGDGSDNGSENGNGGDENETDSASTAVAYTFSIITLFAIISQIHSSIILSY